MSGARQDSTETKNGKWAQRPVKARNFRCAGFTLIELTVVIFILGLVALLVVPRLPFAQERDLGTTARTFAGTLRYLQNHAISTKMYYRLRIRILDGAMEVMRVLPEDEEVAVTDPALMKLALREGVEFADITTSRLGKISEGEAAIDFSPLGADEFLLFHLKSQAGSRFFTVALYPGSGRVEVLEGYQEGTLSDGDGAKDFSLEEKEEGQ
ncbi:MAG TPA: prepilin-type N-terminal cleavage/methylation domain-containing protein [Geobacteraceae bacterium]|nr:prepilin-type N-terminal cleavage/methylation domain-containing protein [Geobacteraceae bacterium]